MKTIKSTLIVDDSKSDIFLTRRILDKAESFGEVCDASGAEEALELLFGSADDWPGTPEGFPPTLVLLDINMPRVDGFEFLERIEKIAGDDVPAVIVMLSTSSNVHDMERAKRSKFVKGYLVKPIDMGNAEELLNSFGEAA